MEYYRDYYRKYLCKQLQDKKGALTLDWIKRMSFDYSQNSNLGIVMTM